jgi:hypothetical protein
MAYRLIQGNLADQRNLADELDGFERHVIQSELDEVERDIIQSEMRITRQRDRIQNEESGGDVATFSRSLLANLKSCLALRYDYRIRILHQLRALERKWGGGRVNSTERLFHSQVILHAEGLISARMVFPA